MIYNYIVKISYTFGTCNIINVSANIMAESRAMGHNYYYNIFIHTFYFIIKW